MKDTGRSETGSFVPERSEAAVVYITELVSPLFLEKVIQLSIPVSGYASAPKSQCYES